MSKTKQKRLGSDSAKTVIEQAKREVPNFIEHYKKFEQKMVIGGYSSSILFCYGRAVAMLSLYWKKSLLELEPEEVYTALFQASWQTIQTFAADPKHLGAKTGMTAVLHTWDKHCRFIRIFIALFREAG
jgi:hypothetical protein